MKKIMLGFAFMLSTFALTAQDFSIPLEGNVGYIDFHEDSNFRDTWYVGGATGFDFSENAGIRGYYWRALEDGEVSEFDNLEIYGAESKVKIPITQQVKPYLVVGGGMLKPFNNYVDTNGNWENDNHFFGSAGAGLDLKFVRFISMTGYARAMFSDFSQVNTLDNDVQTSWNYGASLNFNLGDNGLKKKSNSNASTIVMPEPTQKVDVEKEVEEKLEKIESQDKISELERRIEQLEEEKRRKEEREKLKKELREELMMEYEFERRIEIEAVPVKDDSKKKMTKLSDLKDQNSDLEAQIKELNEKMVALEAQNMVAMETKKSTIATLEKEIIRLEAEKQTNPNSTAVVELEKSIAGLNQKIADLEKQEAETASQKAMADMQSKIDQLEKERRVIEVEKDREYEIEMARLKQQLEMESQLKDLKEQREEVEVVEEVEGVKLLDREFLKATQESLTRDEFKTLLSETEVGEGDTFSDRLFYSHTNGFLGAGFGKDSYGEALIGVKPNFFFAGSKFRLAPEASVGFGDETSINVLANALYDINTTSQNFKPYVGGGAGFIMPNGDFKPAINIAVGSQLKNVLDGKLSAEIAGRNLFKYNQLSVGYEIF